MGNGTSIRQKHNENISSSKWLDLSDRSLLKKEKEWAEQLEREYLYEKEVKQCKEYLKKYKEMDAVLKKELGPKASSFKTSTNSALAEDLSEATVTLDGLMDTLNDIHSIIREYIYKDKRRIVCYYLATTENMGKICTDLYFKAIERYGQIDVVNIYSPNKGQRLQESLLELLIDLCDKSSLVADQLKEYGILEIVIKSLANIDIENLDGVGMNWVTKRLILIYHCAKAGVNRQFFKDQKTLEIVRSFAKSEYVTDETQLLISTLTDYECAESLTIDDQRYINMLMKRFREAVECPNKIADDGSGVEELAVGLNRFAGIDKNKRYIVKNGASPLIVKLANEGDEEQKQAALELMWTLSYNEENKKVILEDSSAIQCLKKWSNSKNHEIRNAALGTLWNLHGIKLEQNDSEKTETVPENNNLSVAHVMISYQWDVQKLMLKVRDELKKRGYKIWMDVDEMGGSTLEAMASAVERAAVVLICMSTKYKDSPNCRAEGEYAFKTNKDIVPLLVEKGFKASGWLGPVIGAKYYIDLTAKVQSFDIYIDNLVRELGNRGRENGLVDGLEQVGERRSRDTDGSLSREDGIGNKVANWTSEQVQIWAEDHQITNEKILSMMGEDLITLFELRLEAPEYFYNHIDKNFGISTIVEIGKLRKALDNLKNK